ncbi:acylphosphatase [uncultured Vibrio sp.]|uniref:acylphosphatase n=1 Tax=uncultured Vibrio sp. TaxID=114054 RepID=UPI00090F0205|nr:acylphosphatase [uncultured Vibrio sp.]OIQ26397.1 MAG: acylphosphatase [Vibrio sp. MedPE-SWchi]
MFQKCYKFTVSGRVQGVGFRYFTTMKANELNLKGYVRNQNNGDVELVASGDEAKLSELETWLANGPRLAKVSQVIKEEVETDATSYHEFKIT